MSDVSKLSQHQSTLPFSGRLVMFIIRHLQQAMASLGGLWRNPFSSLTTMVVLGVSLSLPAALQVLVKNAQGITQSWDSAAQISVFVDPGHSEQSLQSLVARIKTYPEVSDVNFISRSDALVEFQQLSGFGEALAYLDDNPLPAVVTVTPTQQNANSVRVKALLQKLEREPEVSFGRLDLEWLEKLQAIVNLIQHGVLSVALLLVLAVILVIGNTIRLSIINRRDEIKVLKLIGATESFIQRPFLYTGIWYGVIAGSIAGLIVHVMVFYLDGALIQLMDLYEAQNRLETLSLQEWWYLVLFSSSLGWLGSFISVKQHLKKIEPS